jgi:hypothetical protein
MIDGSCKHKQVVAQTVDISNYVSVDFNRRREADYASLRPPGDTSRYVGSRRVLASTGQYEAVVGG